MSTSVAYHMKIENFRKHSEKTDYDQCYVAFLDILGFKNLITSTNQHEVLRIFGSIVQEDKLYDALERDELFEDQNGKAGRTGAYNDALKKANLYIMSDSIVVSAPCGNPEGLAVVVDICDLIQQMLLGLEKPVLLRGAIAKGDYFVGKANSQSNTVAFGKALVDAYLAQENFAIFPRVIVSDEIKDGGYVGKGMSDETKYKPSRLMKDADDGYSFINSIEMYLAIGVDKSSDEKAENRIKAGENKMAVYQELFETTPEYKKLAKLTDDNLKGYASDGLRKKYIWLQKEIVRVERKFLSSRGVYTNGGIALVSM